MLIHIEASALPGRTCGAGTDFPGVANIHVGVQRKDSPGELFGVHPGDAESVRWTLECGTAETADSVEVRGPYVQNRLGGRFVYVSWGTVDGEGVFTMFRRAKLMLDDVDPAVLKAAVRTGHLTARLGLSDGKGQPRCGRVRPQDITWSATAA